MNLADLAPRLEEIRENLIKGAQERVILAAATAMKAEMQDRIFNRGEDIHGSAIGDYSTKASYFTKDKFVRKAAFKPQGKNGLRGVKEKKAIPKSMYLKEGYKEFRDIQGRKTDTKNYKLAGSLEKSIQIVKDGKDTLIAITDADESNKRHWLEAQDNKQVFRGGKTDYKVFKQAVSDEIEYLRNNI